MRTKLPKSSNKQMCNKFSIDANKRFYSQCAQIYDQTLRQHQHTKWYFAEKIKKVLNEHTSGNLKVLGIGTGTGFALKVIADEAPQRHLKLVGCDISQEMLAIAKSKITFADFELFDGINLPFPDRYFNLVLFVSSRHEQK